MTTNLRTSIDEANNTAVKKPAGNRSVTLAEQFRKFHKDEGGSIIIFSLFIFCMMLVVGGIAVDVMRAEHRRTRIQYTLDRAVLAATSLNQTVPAQEVVDDYFEKAGLGPLSPTVVVDQSLNHRRVSADMSSGAAMPRIETVFMRMNFLDAILGDPDPQGVDYLATPAISAAVDGVEKVEISLVLDVSGSMGSSSADGITKIAALQDAAKEFVDTILLNQPEEDTYSISIVPYSTQVTVGEGLLDQYNVTTEHNSSHCADFTSNSFNSTVISPTASLQRTGHFSPVTWGDMTRFDNNDGNDDPMDWSRACYTDSDRQIIPVSGDNVDLKNYIDGLYADGWTSTDVGIKWAAALLDPETRPVVDGLITDTDVEAKFSGRPFDYSEEGVLKVIVVMTDGANTNQYLLNDSVKDGMSPVWLKTKNNGDNKYWIYNPDHQGSKKYYKAYYGEDDTWEFGNAQKWVNAPANNATQLSWPELWKHAPMEFVSDYLFDPADLDSSWTGGSNGWPGFYNRVGWGEKDIRMNNICSAAKANNVLIFTIGFEVEDDNAAKLATCATTAAHFFRVEGVEISDAFSSIAAQLNSLRLVR